MPAHYEHNRVVEDDLGDCSLSYGSNGNGGHHRQHRLVIEFAKEMQVASHNNHNHNYRKQQRKTRKTHDRRNGGSSSLANDNRRVPPPPPPPRNKKHNGSHRSNRSHHSLGSQSTQTTYPSSSTDNDNGRLSNKSNGRSKNSLCSSSNLINNTNHHHRVSGPDLGHHHDNGSVSRGSSIGSNSCRLSASDDDQDGSRRSYENRSFDRSDNFGRHQNYSHQQRQQQQQQQCYHSHSSGGSRAGVGSTRSAASNSISISSRDCSIDHSSFRNSNMLVPTGFVFERRSSKRLLPTLPSSAALSSSSMSTSSQETSSYDHYFHPNSQKSPSDIIIANMTRYPQLRRRIRLWHKQKIAPYWKLTVAQLFCVVYILVLTFSPMPVGMKDPITNDIIDVNSEENTRNGLVYLNDTGRAVVAMGGWQKFCLAMSRMSAFSMYPMLVSVFLTKMKALQIFLSNTPLSMYFGVIKEGHDHHVHAGKYIAFDVWIHTIFHCLRWLSQGNINLLWQTRVGITGIVTLIVTPLIAFPMLYYKRKLTYEVRKALHYLFYVFAIAMCFHVPPSAIPNGGFLAPILGSCIVLYALDATYVYIYLSEKVETTSFHVLSSGVRISMPVSDRFQKQKQRSGFAYICIPWINDKQWHPFSLFEDPSDPSTQQMFLMKTGDWTNAVHASLSRDTTRPCWIKGPFPSPYSHASMYDNQILVASGIGITPALAAINAFKCSRLINLIWAVRDPEMLEFFLDHMYLEHGGWNLIFYTGKKQLTLDAEEWSNNHSSNCRIVKGRPQLSYLIPNIIFGNEYEDETFSLWEQSEEQNIGVKGLHDDIMKTWGMMYCGGSNEVISALRGISIDYNIDLHIDSFAW